MVKNDVMKKTEYNKLVTKLDIIGTTNFVKKANIKKMGQIDKIDKKIPDVTNLVKKNRF